MKKFIFDIQRFDELATVPFGARDASISSGITITDGTLASGSDNADTLAVSSPNGNNDNAFFRSNAVISLRGGNDSIDIKNGINQSSVTITGNDNADTISVSGTYYAIEFSTVTVDGGDGDDFLYIYGGTDGIHPSKVTITGGIGNDTIEIHGGNEGIHGGIAEVFEDKTAASVDGGDGDDRIIIHADNEKGIDISTVTISSGAGNDLISIYGGTYGIGGVGESLNSVFGGSGEIAATVSISGGDGADTISVSAIDSISGGTVTITAGSGDVISVGSGGANYLFDSTDAVTINGATFTANAANTSASLDSSADSTSIRSTWSGTVALSGQNSLADIDGSIVSAAGNYQVVDGRFTSFDTVTPEPTPSVTSDTTSSVTSDTAAISVQFVNAVDLNLVPDGQTGYFVAQVNSSGESVTPIFKTESPAENDTLAGNVTANKIYFAENNHGGQTVTIPSSWNVTATENNDTLNVRGTNVTVTGGAGSDLFALGAEVQNIRLTDLTPAEDNLSFANYIQPGSMRQSFDDNHLVLSADNLRVDLPGMSEMTEEFLDYSVSNAGSSSTIRELLYGNSNSSSSYISFAHWAFGFETSSGF